jgi:gliding motility-associated-like protein
VYVLDANGCTNSQPVTVPLTNNLRTDAGGDKTICEGKSASLTARSNAVSFSWSPAAGLDDPSRLDPVAAPAKTTLYTLTASLGVCQSTATLTVLVNPAPVADAGKDQNPCYGQSVQLTGSGGKCTWSPATGLDDATSSTPTVKSPERTITYQLTVTDGNGCSSLQPAQVTVLVTPPTKVFAGLDTSILAGQPVELDAVDVNNSGFNNFTWSPPERLSNPFVQSPTASPLESVVYTVLASTPNGCSAADSILVKVFAVSDIFVPSGFTPNGDGHNDLLRPIPIGIRTFKYFAVYNRWGQQVFQSADPARGWDGSIHGQAQGAGVYVWMAGGVDYKGELIQRKGTVVLIR